MITLTTLSELSRGNYDKRYAIMRSLSRPIQGVEQIPDLSPSKPLFYDYLNVRNHGQWGRAAFDGMYLPRFLQEMTGDAARKSLNRLYREDKSGLNIAIACTCAEEDLCHRSIVGGLLKGVGCNVKTMRGDGSEYLKYFDMYRAITGPKPAPAPRPVQTPPQQVITNPNDPYAQYQQVLRPQIQQAPAAPAHDPRFYQAAHVSAPGYQPQQQAAPGTYNNRVADMRIDNTEPSCAPERHY